MSLCICLRAQRNLHMVEGMWTNRKMNCFRKVRLMRRRWYILSPHSIAMLRWQVVILVAMLYVSIVTPYEV